MSFADGLREQSPEFQRQREQEALRKIEEDPSDFALQIADLAESVVKRKAESSARAGRTSVSGYISFWNNTDRDYIDNSSGWLIPLVGGFSSCWRLDDHLIESELTHYLCIDKIRVGSGGQGLVVKRFPSGSCGKDCYTLSPKTVDAVCEAVRNKLKDLGFKQVLVEPKLQKFFTETYESVKMLFGLYKGTRSVIRPDGTGTFLWIEVSW